MNKTEFLSQLEYKLRVLPASERQDALEYYEGYLSDAENEAAAIAELGSPGEVAAMIFANYVAKEPDPTTRTRGGVKTALMIIFAIFAVPIGLPLVIGIAAAAFGLFIALLSVVFSVGVVGVTTLAAGMASLIFAPFVFMSDWSSGLTFAGMGLVSFGIGIIFIKNTALLMRGFPKITRFVGKNILRRKHNAIQQ